jgi:CRISPR/Cas system CSM-associated protein Csm2 small subunit
MKTVKELRDSMETPKWTKEDSNAMCAVQSINKAIAVLELERNKITDEFQKKHGLTHVQLQNVYASLIWR